MSKFRSGITSRSAPRYDTFGAEEHWDLGDWLKWHEELTKELGKVYPKDKWGVPRADVYFLEKWREQTIGSQPKNQIELPSLNKAEFDYMKKKAARLYIGTGGMMFEKIVPNDIEKAIRGGELTVEVAKKIGRGLKILGYVLLATGVVVLVGVGAYAYNTFIKDGATPKYKT